MQIKTGKDVDAFIARCQSILNASPGLRVFDVVAHELRNAVLADQLEAQAERDMPSHDPLCDANRGGTCNCFGTNRVSDAYYGNGEPARPRR